jgi:hypothetical protein
MHECWRVARAYLCSPSSLRLASSWLDKLTMNGVLCGDRICLGNRPHRSPLPRCGRGHTNQNRFNQAKNSLYQSREFCGFRIQWFSSG